MWLWPSDTAMSARAQLPLPVSDSQGSVALRLANIVRNRILHVLTYLNAIRAAIPSLDRSPSSQTLTLDEWKTFSIYQVVTDRFALPPSNSFDNGSCPPGSQVYCGGTFQGITSKLDYIQGMGFDAIWISPIVANTGGDKSYHGYWAQDLYAVNPNFGSADDLRTLSASLHERGMYLMVDVVANHMGPQSDHSPGTPEYARVYAPFDSPEHFHHFCTIRNYDDQNEVEQCWLGSEPGDALADLDTENLQVTHLLNTWVGEVVRNYSIDALRIDTVKHVRQSFWPAFIDAANSSFCTGEVLSGDASYVAQYQRIAGMQSLINYPLYYPLIRTFKARAQGFAELKTMVTETLRAQFSDPMALTNFLENHDNPRFPSLLEDGALDPALIKNAITFLLTSDGIPVIYYGQEHMFDGGQDPDNREAFWTSNYNTSSEMYVHIAKLNSLRKILASAGNGISPLITPLTSLYNDQTAWAYQKGNLIVVLSSDGANSNDRNTFEIVTADLRNDSQLVNILTCDTKHIVVIDSQGRAQIEISNGQPLVLYPVQYLAGTGIC